MLEHRLKYVLNEDVFVVLSGISNIIQSLSKTKLSKNNYKRNAALFLIPVCKKSTDYL